MKEYIKKYIAKTIADNYYDVLLVGYEEQEQDFFITLAVVEFLEKLKSKNINYDLNDIFIDTFIELIDKEADNYVCK